LPVFKILDSLRPTATGVDGPPAWFLRIGAPIFCKLSCICLIFHSTSTVPYKLKLAWIRPVPKVSYPAQPADFRPISITPVLTRIMDRTFVQKFIYPNLQKPTLSLIFHVLFTFNPTGSTTAAIITLLDKATHLLFTNPYVIVITLDFSKAFDTVRNSTLLNKMAQLDVPDHVYNWLVDFFTGHMQHAPNKIR